MIIKDFQTKYITARDVRLVPDSYANTKNLCLNIRDAKTGDPLCTATVNPPDPMGFGSIKLEPGTVAIKDWSGNEGVPAAFIQAGIIDATPIRTICSGYVMIGIYRLTPYAMSEIYKVPPAGHKV